MGQYIDLLQSLPRTRRDVAGRKADKSLEVAAVAKQFGREYFDGDRRYGYGGYKYDGRWELVADAIIDHYRLGTGWSGFYPGGPRVLDVGCAKGFLLHELMRANAALRGVGIDISRYAVVERPHPDVVGHLHLGTADALPFPDKSFDLVLSINTLHNLPRPRLIKALQEMRRVSRGSMFVQVDSYRNEAERVLFEDWVLTAETHGTPEFWLELFADARYDGDYFWTVMEG